MKGQPKSIVWFTVSSDPLCRLPSFKTLSIFSGISPPIVVIVLLLSSHPNTPPLSHSLVPSLVARVAFINYRRHHHLYSSHTVPSSIFPLQAQVNIFFFISFRCVLSCLHHFDGRINPIRHSSSPYFQCLFVPSNPRCGSPFHQIHDILYLPLPQISSIFLVSIVSHLARFTQIQPAHQLNLSKSDLQVYSSICPARSTQI